MDWTLLLSLASGVGIAAACGLRAFLPLLAVGLAARAGLVTLSREAAWIASDQVLLALGAATVLEIAADKIPVLDHALDAIATLVRPLAAALGAFALLAHWPAPLAALAGVLLGAGAFGIHAMKAKLRLGSSAATLGHANPVLSLAEDGVTIALIAAALLAPLLVIALFLLIFWGLRRRRRVA